MSDKAAAALRELLARGVENRAYPGAVLGVANADTVLFHEAVGQHVYGGSRDTRADDLFDLASLTKAVATTAVAMRLRDRGILDLDQPVWEILPDFAAQTAAPLENARKRVTPRYLLAHCAGLPAWRPFFRDFPDETERKSVVIRGALDTEPGSREIYSDIGMMIMGMLLETLAGMPLNQLCAREIFEPLGLSDTLFCPPAALIPRIVPTEIPAGAAQPLHGLVHDENARWLGGIAGHAGLFSTLDDLLRFARVLLSDGKLGDSPIFSRDALAVFTRPAHLVPASVRRLGWDGPSGLSSGGSHLSPRSFGHTGFTGTSIWIDPDRPLAVVLLTNAVHPRREVKKHAFFAWRRRLHTAVYECIGPA